MKYYKAKFHYYCLSEDGKCLELFVSTIGENGRFHLIMQEYLPRTSKFFEEITEAEWRQKVKSMIEIIDIYLYREIEMNGIK